MPHPHCDTWQWEEQAMGRETGKLDRGNRKMDIGK